MIIFFGAPGSGKSDQGKRIVEKYEAWNWLSTGEMLRESNDPAIKDAINNGRLVSDETVEKVLFNAIEDTNSECLILDGYPRNEKQAETLVDKIGGDMLALVLDVPDEEIIQRLSSRGRSDDSDEIIRDRIDYYKNSVTKILEVMGRVGADIVHVDGSGTRDEVQDRIEDILLQKGILDATKKN